jgi:hypothetical protein
MTNLPMRSESKAATGEISTSNLRRFFVFFVVSGFCGLVYEVVWVRLAMASFAMGLEVVWIRQLTPYLGNVVYAFAGVLAVYLLATAMGSRDYRFAANCRKPDESASSWSAIALFALIPLVAGSAHSL